MISQDKQTKRCTSDGEEGQRGQREKQEARWQVVSRGVFPPGGGGDLGIVALP